MTDGTGILINGRYRLVEVVGEGGLARIWRGRDLVMDREVAVRELLLPPSLAADDRTELIAGTLREARAAGGIDHPSVITIYDVVQDSGIPWIVMQFVAGPSLDTEIKRAGRLPWQRVAEIGKQVAGALAEAHAAGILHQDLKLDKILLVGQRAIVTDFGLAHVADAATKMTGAATMFSTPGYLAPEQFDDRPVSPATDMWALGATLYCAAEGRPPFDRSTLSDTIGAILARPYGALQHAGPLAGLIGSLLDKDPARRPGASVVAGTLAGYGDAPVAGQPATGSAARFPVPAAGRPQDVVAPFGWPPKPPGPQPATASPSDVIAPFGWPQGPERAITAPARKWPRHWSRKAWAAAIAGVSAAAALIVVALLLSSSPKGHSPSAGTRASLGVTASSGASASPPITVTTPVTATPTPTPSATRPRAAKAGAKCSFVVGGTTTCDSTNPQVRLYANFGNDTSGCTFVRNITWRRDIQ
ncbi:MAG TPA: serine/threonine-protein kinase [Trebonia sp.]|nr:serine/threonine-protein kinase [Trebonia sp.]